MIPEPFVSADEAARFISRPRRFLLALARRGIAGAYPTGTGTQRRVWVFRLSELADAIAAERSSLPNPPKYARMRSGSLRAEREL
jgi:hypothetical protein